MSALSRTAMLRGSMSACAVADWTSLILERSPAIALVSEMTCYAMSWLHVKQKTEIISKLFQCIISHVTTSQTEIKLDNVALKAARRYAIANVKWLLGPRDTSDITSMVSFTFAMGRHLSTSRFV